MEKIKTLYDSKGFYNAEIRYTIEKGGERDIYVVARLVIFKDDNLAKKKPDWAVAI